MPQTAWGKTPQEKWLWGIKPHPKNTVKIMARCKLFAGNDLKKYNFLFRFGTFGTNNALYSI